MTKRIISIVTLAAVCASLFTGCKKDQEPTDTVTLGVKLENVGGPDSKIYMNGDTPQFFSQDEEVYINWTSCSIQVSNNNYIVRPAVNTNGTYYALYPASMVSDNATIIPSTDGNSFTCTVNFPHLQNYVEQDGHQKLDLPVGAVINGSGTVLRFYNLCSLVEVTYTNSSSTPINFTSIEVTAEGKGLYGTNATATVNGIQSKLSINYNNVNSSVVLEIPNTTIEANQTKTFYVIVPPYEGLTTFTAKLRFLKDGAQQSVSRTARAQVDRNQIITLSTNEVPHEDTEISGYFSINDHCKVVFSKGNLQHIGDPTDRTTGWHFADNQYDFFGSTNYANNHLSTTVDLFYWSIEREEWTANEGEGHSYGLRELYNEDIDNYIFSDVEFRDWGYLVIDGDPAKTWFTLSQDEWDYLLNDRCGNRGDELRFNVSITGITDHLSGNNTVHGCLLLPDDWTNDRTPSGIALIHTGVNTISYENFRRLEAVGCVLLPQAGYVYWGGMHNNWSSTSSGEQVGYYWTSDYSGGGDDYGDSYEESYIMSYSYTANDDYANTTVNTDASIANGCSVRLVKPAPGYTYRNAGRSSWGPTSKSK